MNARKASISEKKMHEETHNREYAHHQTRGIAVPHRPVILQEMPQCIPTSSSVSISGCYHLGEGNAHRGIFPHRDEYEPLLEIMRNAHSRQTHFTSWNISGNPYNLWTLLTRGEAIFFVSGSNDRDVPMNTLRDHKGTSFRSRTA